MDVLQVLVFCALFGAAAGDSQANDASNDSRSMSRWEIAPEVSWYRYEEPGVMTNTGVLYGVAGAYTRFLDPKFLRLEGGLSVGEVEYDGSLLDGTPYTSGGNRDLLANIRILGGRLWQTGTWDTQLYLGLAYRYLNDDSTQDWAGYNRHSNYFYVPLGLKGYHDLADHWQLGLGGEVDILLIGVQISDMGDGSSPVTNTQWPGLGARASVEFRRKMGKVDFAAAPFLQYWWVDESSISEDGWYEPPTTPSSTA